jgi:hypothetical protein
MDEGDCLTAYARHPEKLAIVNDRLTVVEGELSDAAAIERAVEGADGVISLLGPGMPVNGTPVAHGTRNILAAMKKHGVLRIVVIATASASDPSDVTPLRSRFFIGIAKLFLRRPTTPSLLGDGVTGTDLSRANTADFSFEATSPSGKLRLSLMLSFRPACQADQHSRRFGALVIRTL